MGQCLFDGSSFFRAHNCRTLRELSGAPATHIIYLPRWCHDPPDARVVAYFITLSSWSPPYARPRWCCGTSHRNVSSLCLHSAALITAKNNCRGHRWTLKPFFQAVFATLSMMAAAITVRIHWRCAHVVQTCLGDHHRLLESSPPAHGRRLRRGCRALSPSASQWQLP